MNYWVFTIGMRDLRPPTEWLLRWPHHVHESWFARTKRPSGVAAGDRAIVYGSLGTGFLAAVEIVSHEPLANSHDRFPWKLEHKLLVYKAADDHVALPSAAGINPKRIARGPHTMIEADEYHAALRELVAAAARSAA